MAQSRKYFIEQITKLGFKKHYPKGIIFKYTQRDFFKCHPFAFGLSSKGSGIDVAVYNLESKTNRHFDNYKDALLFFNHLKTEAAQVAAQAQESSVKIKRKK